MAAVNFTLRKATHADIDELIAMAKPTFDAFFPVAISANRMRTVLRNLVAGFSAQGYGYVTVAEAGGRPVAFLAGVCGPFEPWASDLAAVELLIFVEQEHRRTRAALRLMEDFEAWARSKGSAVVVMASQHSLAGERVGRLYERRGFRPMETNFVKRL